MPTDVPTDCADGCGVRRRVRRRRDAVDAASRMDHRRERRSIDRASSRDREALELKRKLEESAANLARLVRRKEALARAVATPSTPDAGGVSSASMTNDETREVTPDDEDVDAVERGEGFLSKTMQKFLQRQCVPAAKKMAISPAKAAKAAKAKAAKTMAISPAKAPKAAKAKAAKAGRGRFQLPRREYAPKRKLNDEQLAECYTVMHAAVDAGDLERCEELRKYFVRHEGKFSNPYKWDHELVACCSRDGRRPIATLAWAFSKGARRDAKAAFFACERVDHELRRDEDGNYTDSLTVLQFLHEQGAVRIDYDTMYCACEFGNLACLEWMHQNIRGLRFADWPTSKNPQGQDNDLMLIAAKNGHLPVLQYLYDNDCDFTDADARDAIEQVMNREPSSPLGWHAVVRWIQNTDEYKAYRSVDEDDPLRAN